PRAVERGRDEDALFLVALLATVVGLLELREVDAVARRAKLGRKTVPRTERRRAPPGAGREKAGRAVGAGLGRPPPAFAASSRRDPHGPRFRVVPRRVYDPGAV